MPDFLYHNKVYYNPVEFVMDRIGGSWKMPVLWRLRNKSMRYSELKKDILHISDKMLAAKLKELQGEGFITRKVYAAVPPKVEYSLTKRGKRAIVMIEQIRVYGKELMKEFKVEPKRRGLVKNGVAAAKN
jgi:DNA-binding HxlR family transcriptional regulator